MICPKCQSAIPEDKNFCPKCGILVRFSEPIPYTPKVDKTNHQAIFPMASDAKKLSFVGLITSIIGVGLLFALIGLIWGIIALVKINKSKGQLKGESLAIESIVLSIITFIVFIVWVNLIIPPIGVGQYRSWVSRAKAEQQSLATAIESYYIDNGKYPLPDYDEKGRPVISRALTTPVAFITSLFHEPFKDKGKGLYGYGVDTLREHWIVTSYGPDFVDGNSKVKGGKVFPIEKAASDSLLGYELEGSGFTYDPTNGTHSGGDVWRRGP